MKLQTHIAFGLFIGALFYYFLNFSFGYVLLAGFASYLPDIDWAMQFKHGFGKTLSFNPIGRFFTIFGRFVFLQFFLT